MAVLEAIPIAKTMWSPPEHAMPEVVPAQQPPQEETHREEQMPREGGLESGVFASGPTVGSGSRRSCPALMPTALDMGRKVKSSASLTARRFVAVWPSQTCGFNVVWLALAVKTTSCSLNNSRRAKLLEQGALRGASCGMKPSMTQL